ncbi:MAG TPA: methionyl-tRNA formyltransferase, partial [Clostridiaceae bacterium]
MKIVFMGTPEFAVPSLERLIAEFEVAAVLTQPDKPKGRGKRVAMSEVKEAALNHGLTVCQPVNLRKDEELIKILKDMEPDFIVVVAYGQILSKEVLDIPKYGCVNLHASLLPKYRGAAPINWAIIRGERMSGNTTMLMDVGLDTGDMLLKSEVHITDSMTAGELHDILKEDGSELLVETLRKLAEGKIERQKQENWDGFYASMLNKEMAAINWTKSSNEIHNLVRGLNPWPIAYTHYKDSIMKIYSSDVLVSESASKAGTITDVSKEGVRVSCGKGEIMIKKVQFPGGKPLDVSEYIKGHKIDI